MIPAARARFREFATGILRHHRPRGAALRWAAARGRALVLVYHRVAPEGPASHQVVRSMHSALFRQQLEALARMGDIVPLTELLAARRNNHVPRFAITFDDDDVGHVEYVVPVLQAVQAHATFFLSGRALHNLPPYWWTVIEHSIRARGMDHTRRALGLNDVRADAPDDLAIALEGSPLVDKIAMLLPTPDQREMGAAEIRALVDAGMTVGFHTLHHQVVSLLEGADLESAMLAGRAELATAARAPVNLLAYPHGRVNATAARAAERAGFVAAWATGGRPITHRSDRFVLGRWEPGPLPPEDFVAAVAARLLRFPTAPRTGSRQPA